MFTIEVFVGSKYGRWVKHARLYIDRDHASSAIDALERAERKVEANSFLRRVVPA